MIYQIIIDWILGEGNKQRTANYLEPLTPTQAKQIYKEFHNKVTSMSARPNYDTLQDVLEVPEQW